MKTLFSIFLAITGAFLFSYAVFAFDAPTADPPGANVPAPVNVGPDAQIKSGGLWVDSLGVDGNITDAFGGVIFDGGTRKIRESSLPFSKGDIVDPGDRSLISGLSTYTSQYMRLNNLGISGTNASQVRCGQTFGSNNSITGSYCEDPAASCSGGQCVVPRKRVFVSTRSTDGDFHGLNGLSAPRLADSFCQADANDAGLGGTWTAWLSYKDGAGTEFHAKDRIADSPNGWKRVDGVVVANNMSDLLDGNIDAPINLHANGTAPTPNSSKQNPWTGTLEDGTLESRNDGSCYGSVSGSLFSWNSNSTNTDGRIGWIQGVDEAWTQRTRRICERRSSSNPVRAGFYCFER